MKTGRNELCSCGSGKKYKKCCIEKENKVIKELSEEINKHLLKDPYDISCPEDDYNSKQEIINAYTSAGYTVIIEDNDPDYILVNPICPHGVAEHGFYFELIHDKWGCTSSESGDSCRICDFIQHHKSIPICPKCNNPIPILSEQERIKYYKKELDYLIIAVCHNCGSSYLTGNQDAI